MDRYHQMPTVVGSATMNTRVYNPSTQIEFCLSTIQEGNAIPKLIAPGPSGFPYRSQFRRAVSSVRAW